jgi:hypothetical protein
VIQITEPGVERQGIETLATRRDRREFRIDPACFTRPRNGIGQGAEERPQSKGHSAWRNSALSQHFGERPVVMRQEQRGFAANFCRVYFSSLSTRDGARRPALQLSI